MEFLKWIGYGIVSIIGVGLTIGVSMILTLIGATMGSLAFGAGIVFMGMLALKEYFEGSDKPKKDE